MTIDKQKLKALAEAATRGEWTCTDKHDGRFWHIKAGNQAIGATHAAGRKSPMAGVFEANAKFIAAASPVTVLALLAEIEEDAMHMRAFGEVMRSQAEQVDHLKAENEALRREREGKVLCDLDLFETLRDSANTEADEHRQCMATYRPLRQENLDAVVKKCDDLLAAMAKDGGHE